MVLHNMWNVNNVEHFLFCSTCTLYTHAIIHVKLHASHHVLVVMVCGLVCENNMQQLEQALLVTVCI